MQAAFLSRQQESLAQFQFASGAAMSPESLCLTQFQIGLSPALGAPVPSPMRRQGGGLMATLAELSSSAGVAGQRTAALVRTTSCTSALLAAVALEQEQQQLQQLQSREEAAAAALAALSGQSGGGTTRTFSRSPLGGASKRQH